MVASFKDGVPELREAFVCLEFYVSVIFVTDLNPRAILKLTASCWDWKRSQLCISHFSHRLTKYLLKEGRVYVGSV